MLTRVIALAGLLSLAGCGSIDYVSLQPATLTGSVFVMWVGEGDGAGDGKFLFVPDPHDPLRFSRADPHSHGAMIEPHLMYTDGGSIPSIAQAFNGLHPWGYAPAYMIHDWIYTAHHCIVDGNDSSKYDQVRAVTFDDSAAILGEAIQGLVYQHQVQRRDLAAGAITDAVDSSVAKNLWDKVGACADLQVSAIDAAKAEKAVPGSTQARLKSNFRGPGTGLPTATVRPARIIAHIKL